LDHSSGDLTASANLAENAVRLAQQAGDTAREAQGYRQWAGTLHKQRELAAAHRKFEIGLDLAQEAGQRGLQGDCLSGLGWVCVDGWNLTVGEAYLGQALSIARELADRPREAMAIFNLGVLAYFRLDRVAAKDCCQQALKISQETGFRNSEILASNVLGSLHLRYGDYARAQTYAERGLRTGRETAAWDLVPYSLLCLGVQHQRTGDLQRSRGYALEALPLSRKMGRQDLEARSNFHIGVSFYFQGDHSAAQPYLQQAADLGREGGWPDRQDMGLTGLGLNAMAQGDYGVARDALERAQCLLREFPEQDVFARDDEAYAQSALALLHHRLGKDQQAVHYARRALEIHRATFGPDRPALALTRLGHALVGLGKFEDGRAAYQEALDLRRDLGQAHLATEPLAGLARVALAQGDVMGAKTCVEEILSHLEKSALASGGGHPLDGTDEPLRILLTCYRVLRANQDPRAEKLLTEGHQLLQERASKIEDERLRRSYLENVRAHREIVCEWEDLGRRS
jgi:tetratricopeptide (TPR) repeat protein